MQLSEYAQRLKNTGIKIHFEADQEEFNLIESSLCSTEFEQVKDDYENGNDAAWFIAIVWLSFSGVESDKDYLGQCSYASFDDFTGIDNESFDGMLKTCYDDLVEQFSTPRLELPKIV